MSTQYNGDVRVGPWMYELLHTSRFSARRKTEAKEREGGRKKERNEEKSFSFSEGKKKTVARDSRFIHGQVYGAKKDFSFEM